MQDSNNNNNISSSLVAADCDHRRNIISQNPRALRDEDTHRLEFQYYQPLSSFDYVRADLEAMLMPNNQQLEESSTSREEESGRGKLVKHWNDVAAGRFCIPEKWGQEALLKDWGDCSLFDELLAPKGIVSAREALVAEQKRGRTRQLIKDGVYVLS